MQHNLATAREAYEDLVAKEKAGVDIYEDDACGQILETLMMAINPEESDLSDWIDAIEYDWVESLEGDELPAELDAFYTEETMAIYGRVLDTIPENEEEIDDIEIDLAMVNDFITFYGKAFVERGQIVLTYAQKHGVTSANGGHHHHDGDCC